MTSLSEQTVTTPQGTFHCLSVGSGPLALCLHGFPDTAHSFRYLLPELAEKGFHAVAPFQRGYQPTGPLPDGRYQSGQLGIDANAIHDALDADDTAVIIGHDWGAVGTYAALHLAPEKWSRAVGMAVPPGPIMMSALLEYAQIKRSWYMLFFLNPLADIVLPGNNLEFLDRLWEDWSPGWDATHDLAFVKAALPDSASLGAALSYYRQTLDPSRQSPDLAAAQNGTFTMPTTPLLYLHGAMDGCVGVEYAHRVAPLLPVESTLQIIEEAGHFLHLEKAEQVNQRIVDWVSAHHSPAMTAHPLPA